MSDDLSKYTKEELRKELQRRSEDFYVEKYVECGLFTQEGTLINSPKGYKLFVYGYVTKGEYVVQLLNAGYRYLGGE